MLLEYVLKFQDCISPQPFISSPPVMYNIEFHRNNDSWGLWQRLLPGIQGEKFVRNETGKQTLWSEERLGIRKLALVEWWQAPPTGEEALGSLTNPVLHPWAGVHTSCAFVHPKLLTLNPFLSRTLGSTVAVFFPQTLWLLTTQSKTLWFS